MKEIVIATLILVFNDGRPDEIAAGIEPGGMPVCVAGIIAAKKLAAIGDMPPGVSSIYMECKRIKTVPIERFKQSDEA